MPIVSTVLVLVVAALHLYFMVLEMFLWTTPRGLKIFGQTQEQANATARLAKNQGLYNGLLAAGLIWAALARDPHVAFDLRVFFLGCVLVAGIYGAITASRSILFAQALPALVALVSVWLARGAA